MASLTDRVVAVVALIVLISALILFLIADNLVPHDVAAGALLTAATGVVLVAVGVGAFPSGRTDPKRTILQQELDYQERRQRTYVALIVLALGVTLLLAVTVTTAPAGSAAAASPTADAKPAPSAAASSGG